MPRMGARVVLYPNNDALWHNDFCPGMNGMFNAYYWLT